ncbi:MAG: DUF423 domain-containing protein [Magnetococcales bacterium]|nr:DUF423 domain-containing protein [Magnetococcales bacterium]
MTRFFIMAGALNCFLAVGLGAIGKHGVRSNFGEQAFDIFQTASHYQMSHGLGLILIGLCCRFFPMTPPFFRAGWVMLIGIMLFSGSLYLFALTKLSFLAWLTPFGGLTLLFAWLLLAWAGFGTDSPS